MEARNNNRSQWVQKLLMGNKAFMICLGLCIINHPQGVYYGGTIAAPAIQRIFANILPYLGIEQTGTEKD